MVPLLIYYGAKAYVAVKAIDLVVNAPKRREELRSQGTFKRESLMPGDVLLKLGDDSFLNDVIGVAQMFSKHSHVVHAAIVGTVPDRVIEMDKDGVVESSLLTKNRNISYLVYRPQFGMAVHRKAGEIAQELLKIHAAHGKLGYSKSSAVGSLRSVDKVPSADALRSLLREIRGGKKYDMFCSEFVVLCYHFAAVELGLRPTEYFDVAAARHNPSFMAADMRESGLWEPLGALKKGVR